MRRLILAAALVAGLGGCQVFQASDSSTQEGTVKAFMAACVTYKNAFSAINIADQVHPLTPAQVTKINAIDVEVAKLCPPGGAMPSNALGGVVTILTSIDGLVAAAKQ